MRSTLVAGFKAYDLMVPVTRAELIGLIVSATLLSVALPIFQLPGAAWVYIITQGVVTVLLIRSLKNTLGLTLTILLKPTREDFTLLAASIRSALRRQAT
jgi:hypothetical protein